MLANAVRVLVVDDSENDFELLIRALSIGGMQIHEARRVENESQMVEALAEERWDVVCVDWILPAYSAPDVLSLLNSVAGSPPCIVVSGVVGEETAVLAMKLGAKDFLRKDQIAGCAVNVFRELLFSGFSGK